MLVKQAKKTKKYSWIANKKYTPWKMADFLANVSETKIVKFEASTFAMT